jgi:tricorn protease
MKMYIRLLLTALSIPGFMQVIFAIDTENTRLLWQPAISKTHIAFIYGEDLWVANRDGSYPRRITVSEGQESNPLRTSQ